MYCPECGNDAGNAKFCPECGANLAGVKDALSGKPAAEPRPPSRAAARPPPDGRRRPAAPSASRRPSSGAASAPSPSSSSSSSSWSPAASAAAAPTTRRGQRQRRAPSRPSAPTRAAATASSSPAPTTCTTRATPQFQNQNFEQGGAYFAAAAKVYAAAWKKQATDPSVGTDYAVALFYSGDIPGALKQIDAVLKANPDFQKGWLNKGIFLSHEAPACQAARRRPRRPPSTIDEAQAGAHQGRRARPEVRGRQAGRPGLQQLPQ